MQAFLRHIVAFLDGDDWWVKEKLSVVVDYLAARPHIGDLDSRVLEPLDNPFGPRSSLM